MPTRISEIMGLDRKHLEDKGVYDAMIDYDSRLHIDPALLDKCKVPEFAQASKKVALYFSDILRLIHGSKAQNDALWRQARTLLTFGEGLNTGLGYSTKGTAGSGIGKEMAERIVATVAEIVAAGVNDHRIFELVPVFEAKIGPDRISDMISIILKDEFIAFTQRMANELGVAIPTNDKGIQYVFVPKILLSDLPISEEFEDVQIAVAYNEAQREVLNELIGKTWKKTAADLSKDDLKTLLIQNPELLKELLGNYKARGGSGYDFVVDHLGIMLWDVLGGEFTQQHPLDIQKFQKVTADNIMEVLLMICEQFKKLIENNGLVEHLYDSKDKLRPERFPQLLFYAIADCYCRANNLDLNREINAGPGALDFKVSDGSAKVNLEIKYSKNGKLVEGYTKQLPTYNRAEGIQDQDSIYLVIRINDNRDHIIDEIKQIIADRGEQGVGSPKLFVVDGIIKPSASKR